MGELLSYLLDIIVPPRPTERVVRSLTVDTLLSLGGEEPLPYHEPRVTALVWELKYHGTGRSAALAGEYLSEILLAAASEELGVPLLVPVPMHATRRRERGHNQTELLCKAALQAMRETVRKNSLVEAEGRPEDFFSGSFVASKLAPLEYVPKALTRTVNTKTQQGLPRAERLKNIRNSMTAGPDAKKIAGRVCIVVDDVTTTGATFEEAKRALRQAGARAVHCIALARS